MNAVNTVSEIHHLGEYVTGQNEGRKDQAITGNDLYNFGVQTDANFMTVRGDIRNIGTVMNSEFKLVDNEFKGVYNEFKGVYNEFKLVRMEMASGFAAVDARFVAVDAEFKVVRAEMREGFAKLPITITVWVCSTMIALIGLVATVAAVVINQIK